MSAEIPSISQVPSSTPAPAPAPAAAARTPSQSAGRRLAATGELEAPQDADDVRVTGAVALQLATPYVLLIHVAYTSSTVATVPYKCHLQWSNMLGWALEAGGVAVATAGQEVKLRSLQLAVQPPEAAPASQRGRGDHQCPSTDNSRQRSRHHAAHGDVGRQWHLHQGAILEQFRLYWHNSASYALVYHRFRQSCIITLWHEGAAVQLLGTVLMTRLAATRIGAAELGA